VGADEASGGQLSPGAEALAVAGRNALSFALDIVKKDTVTFPSRTF
jgi:hypothetical protein